MRSVVASRAVFAPGSADRTGRQDVDSATVFVVCSLYSMYGLFFPFVLDFVIAYSSAPELFTLERYNRIRECTFNSHLQLSSPDITQYIPKLLLLVIFIIYLFQVGSFSLLAHSPHWFVFSNLNKWCVLSTLCARDQKTRGVSCPVHNLCSSHTDGSRHDGIWRCQDWSLIISATLFVTRCPVGMLTICKTPNYSNPRKETVLNLRIPVACVLFFFRKC